MICHFFSFNVQVGPYLYTNQNGFQVPQTTAAGELGNTVEWSIATED
jgi:hypothetical protein